MIALLAACGARGPTEPPPVARIELMVDWPGAHPATIEALLAVPLEEALLARPDVEHVFTTSAAGRLTGRVLFAPEYPEHHSKPPTLRVRRTLSSLDGPPGASTPQVWIPSRLPIRAFRHDRPLDAAALRSSLERTANVHGVQIYGADRGAHVVVDPARLASTGVRFDQVRQAIAERPEPATLRSVTLGPDLRVGDVASVERAGPTLDVRSANGDPALLVEVRAASFATLPSDLGLVALDHRVELVGPAVGSVLDGVAGVSLVAHGPAQATVFFVDGPARDAALWSWQGLPALRARPVREPAQRLVWGSEAAPPLDLPAISDAAEPVSTVTFELDRERAGALGLAAADVAAQVASATGETVAPGLTVSLQGGMEAVRVGPGQRIPLSSIGTMALTPEPAAITRWNGQRSTELVVTSAQPLDAAQVDAALAYAGLTLPFWLGPD